MIASYIRVSTNDQFPETQEHAISMYLKSRELKTDLSFVDHGYTGKNGNRPRLNALLKAVETNQIKVIVIYKFDRLFRSLKHLMRLLELFKKHEVQLISITEGLDPNTHIGRMVTQMLGSIAEFESEIISERTKSGIARSRAEGQKWGAPTKYGKEAICNVLDLRSKGLSIRAIKKETGMSIATIHHFIKENVHELSKITQR